MASASQAAWQVVAPDALPTNGPPTVESVTHMLVCACAGSSTESTIGLLHFDGTAIDATDPTPITVNSFLREVS